MQDLLDVHRNELVEAMEAHNADIAAVQQKYLDAIHRSREKLAAAMTERLLVWNGEVDLPCVARDASCAGG